MKSVFDIGDKVLHHWDRWTSYENLTAFKINTRIECADALNSFNDELWDRKIDDLVDEAIRLDLPEFGETIVNVIMDEETQLNTPEHIPSCEEKDLKNDEPINKIDEPEDPVE